jgi:hypothetical protein
MGYKVSVVSNNCCIIQDFEVYTGKATKYQGQWGFGAVANIERTLLQSIPQGCWAQDLH